jgi:hypothetical protein
MTTAPESDTLVPEGDQTITDAVARNASAATLSA